MRRRSPRPAAVRMRGGGEAEVRRRGPAMAEEAAVRAQAEAEAVRRLKQDKADPDEVRPATEGLGRGWRGFGAGVGEGGCSGVARGLLGGCCEWGAGGGPL